MDRLLKALEKKGVDAVLVINIENSSRASSLYFSGFTGSFSILLMTPVRRIMVTDARYTEQAKRETDFEVVEVRNEDVFGKVRKILEGIDVKIIGVEEERLSLSHFRKLSAALEGRTFVGVDEEIKSVRMVKDENEIEKIKRAVEISEKAFLRTVERIHSGMTEREIATLLEYHMRSEGADAIAFETIVASGWRSALPHGKATNKIVEEGEVIVIDFGAVYENYCADITRVVCVGEPSEKVKEVHAIVLEAQERALENARAGITGKQLDAFARDFIAKMGFGEKFGHGLGHGLGIEVHEEPGVNPRNEKSLPESSVITIEPGIYIEREFGIRIEEDVVLREDGCEILTNLSRSIFIV